jgi:tRNA1Val (adenine37-N6)-methyltransferase
MSFIATTQDIFLKGRLTIEQPKAGFRSGSDAVLLAAAAASIPFQHAIEAGCGAGAALLSLQALCADRPGRLAGLEKDDAMANLANANVHANGYIANIDIFMGDILAPPRSLHAKFDLVFSNPPFFDDKGAIREPAPDRQAAYILGAPLVDWISGMLILCAPKGRMLLIHRAERLPDILDALKGKAGDIGVCPIRPRPGENAKRVIVSAQKGSRAPMRLLAGIDMHPGVGEGRFSPAYEAICDGGVLSV